MATKTLAVLNLGQTVVVAIGVTAMMWRAAAGVVAGELTVGDLVLVNAYLLQLSAPLFLLGMIYRELKQALTNMERLFGLLDERQDVQDAPGAVRPATPAGRACASSTCASATTRAARSCTASTSRSRRAARSRWSAIPARASRRSRACCTASTTSTAGRDPRSTAATCATAPRTRCARAIAHRSAGHRAVQRHDLLQHPLRPPRGEPRGSGGRRARRAHPRRSSQRCRTATKRRSASAA